MQDKARVENEKALDRFKELTTSHLQEKQNTDKLLREADQRGKEAFMAQVKLEGRYALTFCVFLILLHIYR